MWELKKIYIYYHTTKNYHQNKKKTQLFLIYQILSNIWKNFKLKQQEFTF